MTTENKQSVINFNELVQKGLELKTLPGGGEGSEGQLFSFKHEGEDLVVKMRFQGNFKTEEAKIMTDLKHENLMDCVAIQPALTSGKEIMIMKKAHKCLFDMMYDYEVTVDSAIQFATDIAKGMAYMHSMGYIHRDLKPDNVLVFLKDGKEVCKVADFGASIRGDERTEFSFSDGPFGTPRYWAPEMFAGKVCTRTVDIFSFGVTLIYMLMDFKASHTLASLYDIAFCCCQKDPKIRIQSFDIIIEKLNAVSVKHHTPPEVNLSKEAKLKSAEVDIFSMFMRRVCNKLLPPVRPV
jgi:serine/threonine protein kinase